MARYTKVRRRKNSIGKWCMKDDCTVSATVTATRKMPNGFRLDVFYCVEHAKEGGVI